MPDDLETTTAALIDRKRDLAESSAEYRFIVRQLRGLWYTREEAAGIIGISTRWAGGNIAGRSNAARMPPR